MVKVARRGPAPIAKELATIVLERTDAKRVVRVAGREGKEGFGRGEGEEGQGEDG